MAPTSSLLYFFPVSSPLLLLTHLPLSLSTQIPFSPAQSPLRPSAITLLSSSLFSPYHLDLSSLPLRPSSPLPTRFSPILPLLPSLLPYPIPCQISPSTFLYCPPAFLPQYAPIPLTLCCSPSLLPAPSLSFPESGSRAEMGSPPISALLSLSHPYDLLILLHSSSLLR